MGALRDMNQKAWSVPGECAIVSHSAVFLFVVCKNSHPQWSSEFTFFRCGYLGDNYRLARFSMRQSSAATSTFTNKS